MDECYTSVTSEKKVYFLSTKLGLDICQICSKEEKETEGFPNFPIIQVSTENPSRVARFFKYVQCYICCVVYSPSNNHSPV